MMKKKKKRKKKKKKKEEKDEKEQMKREEEGGGRVEREKRVEVRRSGMDDGRVGKKEGKGIDRE